jgi:hypothetical protein
MKWCALVWGLLMSAASALGQPANPYQPWARVLANHVNERGEVDFHAVAADQTDLATFLDYVAQVSPRSAPKSFPDKAAQLAHYLNAYNALSMFNVIDSGFPKSLGAVRRVAFFGVKRFSIGGERMSLYTLENDVIRPLGDERVHFALNCMSVSCPRLPREPFRPEQLDRTLDEKAREFFAEPRNVEVLPGRKLIRVSSILRFYRQDFLARSSTLIAYINRYRAQPVPEDYALEFIEYDWTVNDSRR